MPITTKQATTIIQQVADQHGITDAFDLFDADYIAQMVARINQRPMPAGHTRDDIFAMWVCDDLGVLDDWDPTQMRQQQMDAR
jgi:hypothetical protein